MPFSALPCGSAPLHCITGAMLGFAVDTAPCSGSRSVQRISVCDIAGMEALRWHRAALAILAYHRTAEYQR